jgi:hypothetical protein
MGDMLSSYIEKRPQFNLPLFQVLTAAGFQGHCSVHTIAAGSSLASDSSFNSVCN